MKIIYLPFAIFFMIMSISYAQQDTPTDAELRLASFAKLREKVRAATVPKNIKQINEELRPFDNNYIPDGDGPFPVVLFFHGCSGRTLTHEKDWAKRFNSENIAVISVDSYSGRGINWQDACDFKTMIPWQRASDVIATIQYVKSLDKIDDDHIYLAGFSHGAMTLWAAEVFASDQKAPIGLDKWPDNGFSGVKGSFLFYGPCMEPWTIDVPTEMFLGEKDQYIDEQLCIDYKRNHPKQAQPLNYTIYPGATHTFDHAKPNKSNIEAGSVYDEKATLDAWEKIKKIIK